MRLSAREGKRTSSGMASSRAARSALNFSSLLRLFGMALPRFLFLRAVLFHEASLFQGALLLRIDNQQVFKACLKDPPPPEQQPNGRPVLVRFDLECPHGFLLGRSPGCGSRKA